jgi:deoxyxylulose-5-phosphate synthase
VLCPSSAEEYVNMLDWSIEQKEHPVLILIPGNAVTHRAADKSFGDINKYKVEQQGEKVAIIALGDFYQKAKRQPQPSRRNWDSSRHLSILGLAVVWTKNFWRI